MKIGIVGAGKIGATLARLLSKLGHEVVLANSKGPNSLQELVRELGPRVRAGTVEDAAQFGQVVIAAVPLKAYTLLPAAAFSEKVLVDATNYYPERDGHIRELDDQETTSSELIAKHLNAPKLVKAFNTVYFEHLAKEGNLHLPMGQRKAIFLAGDDSVAKKLVAGLIEDLGFAPVDTGSLREGGERQQPGSAIYNHLMNGQEAEAAISQRA